MRIETEETIFGVFIALVICAAIAACIWILIKPQREWSWNPNYMHCGDFSKDTANCVDNEKLYTCVRDWNNDTIFCGQKLVR